MGSHLIHSESTVIVRLILSQTLRDQFKSQQQKACSEKVKTTGEAGGLSKPYKGIIQPRLKAHEKFANRN
jgi:hypothetical protein